MAHSKAKRTKSDHDWARFRHIRKALRQHMKRAYMDYINNLVDPEKDEGNKNLWRYLKSQKQDHVGVAPLKSDDKLVTDAAGKADILNRQFSSVFTQEQISTMPDKGASPYPNLPKITITRNGVEALLQKVKPKKTSGPDLIPAVLYCPSSSSSHLTQEQYPTIGELLTLYQSSKKVTVSWPQITARYPSQP